MISAASSPLIESCDDDDDVAFIQYKIRMNCCVLLKIIIKVHK